MKPEEKKRFKWSFDKYAALKDKHATLRDKLATLKDCEGAALMDEIVALEDEIVTLNRQIDIDLEVLKMVLNFLMILTRTSSIWFSRCLRCLNFPEETIAELIALKRRRQKQNLPQWKLNLELATEVLLLLWAIHIQIRFQNLSLPPSKKRNID